MRWLQGCTLGPLPAAGRGVCTGAWAGRRDFSGEKGAVGRDSTMGSALGTVCTDKVCTGGLH